MKKVESDAYEYVDRIDVVLRNHNVIIAEAGSVSVIDTSAPVQRPTSTPAPQQTQQGDLFREASVLKPKFLEKESNLLEVLHWIKQARNYITAGYRDTPPNEGTYKYLIPFLHHNWSNALEKYDPDKKPITEILNALEIEAKKGDPKHNRRLKMLQIRRGSDSHSDFVVKLIEAGNVIEFEKMTLAEFIIHLFIRDADQTMGKMAQEILKEERPDTNNLVNKIKEYEAESWYSQKKEFSRMASTRIRGTANHVTLKPMTNPIVGSVRIVKRRAGK